jgi:ABC-2 type transport system permease protein
VNRVRFIARKEIYHILRDPRSLLVIFAMPVLMTFLYGFAINLDIETVTIGFIDDDRSARSQDLMETFYRSTYFSPPETEIDPRDIEGALQRREASGVLVIRQGFAEALSRGRRFSLGLIVDGSDNLLAAAVQAYSQGALAGFLANRLPPGTRRPGIILSEEVLFNPDLKSSHFFVPGIVALILIMISALLTSVTIAREKETGTMEQLLVAPVTARQIVVGKVLPYILIAFLDGMLVILFARLVFGVPFQGSLLLLMFFTVLYVSAALSIGILISSRVRTQQVAMMFALVITMLPSVMLSGFIFAIKVMPLPLRVISHFLPARYYITATRGILLKGSGFGALSAQAGALVALSAVLIAVATKKFKAGGSP